MKSYIRLLFVCILCVFLTGCVGRDAPAPTKEKVLEAVSEECPTEEVALIGVTELSEIPQHVEYTFQSTERELQFTVDSYLKPVQIDASVSDKLFTKAIEVGYADAIHGLYQDEITDIMQPITEHPDIEGSGGLFCIQIDSFSDLKKIDIPLVEANKVYAKELEYNTQEFLTENYIAAVHIFAGPDRKELIDFNIDGNALAQDCYMQAAKQYTQYVVDGSIEDETVPTVWLERVHPYLSEITLDGIPMAYGMRTLPFTKNDESETVEVFTYGYKYAQYDYDINSYVLGCDMGKIEDTVHPCAIIQEYAVALGIPYSLEITTTSSPSTNLYHSTWMVGEDTWDMYADCEKVVILNNGDAIYQYKPTGIYGNAENESFCTKGIYIPVSDFAQMFGLYWTVDESNKTLNFTTDIAHGESNSSNTEAAEAVEDIARDQLGLIAPGETVFYDIGN